VSFAAEYEAAFAQFLSNPSERSLRSAYELGRDAVAADISVLKIVSVHHTALARAVDGRRETEQQSTVIGAADFLIESLAAFEMVQRGFSEARRAAFVERRNSRILRHLSTLLSDESLASGDLAALEEALQLVAENAREITDAELSRVQVLAPTLANPIEVISEDAGPDTWSEVLAPDVRAAGPARGRERAFEVPLLSLSGSTLGTIMVTGKGTGAFTGDDEAVLRQISEMAGAAIERALAYRG